MTKNVSNSNSKVPDITPESMHFQLFLIGTVSVLVALFSLMNLPHTNTREAQVSAAVSRLVIGLQVLGCYFAFVGSIFGHKFLRRSSRSELQGQVENERDS